MIRLSDAATLFHADCREAIKQIPSDSLDSCVTDPPYALVSVVKRFGGANAAPAKGNEAYMRASAGFMGQTWDTGEVAFSTEFWAEVYRVLKPGAFVAAFGASRGYHRMACAIEDAGFEIRDSLMWIYGTGFPKSQDVSKFVDKELGADHQTDSDVPATAAAEWQGWGTALKPAFEPIVLARKPLSEGTVAANVLKWRTGALNIGASRVEAPGETITNHSRGSDAAEAGKERGWRPKEQETHQSAGQAMGRWPANVVTDGSDEVVSMFPVTSSGAIAAHHRDGGKESGTFGAMAGRQRSDMAASTGSAARFFYSAKASKADRNGSKHPTVKPISLMEWLATLITPPGGTILDPFAGSGTTGIAAQNKGFRVILCERESEYVADIKNRFGTCQPRLVIDLERIGESRLILPPPPYRASPSIIPPPPYQS